MTGGEAFLLDPDERLLNDELVALTPLEQQDAERLLRLLERHVRATGLGACRGASRRVASARSGRFRRLAPRAERRGARGGERGPAHRLAA